MSILINNEFSVFDQCFSIDMLEKNIDVLDVNNIRKSLSLKPIKTCKEYFDKMLTTLNASYDNKILSNNNKVSYMNYLKTNVYESLKFINTDYFFTTFLERKLFLDSLKVLKYNNVITEKSIYSDSSLTGRVSIKSGTNFLTMKKENRKNLFYKEDYSLFEIDFKSCEPSFFLSTITKEKIEDVYNFFIDKFNLNIKRAKFKISFLAMLYGASEYNVSKISGLKQQQIKEIKAWMKINTLKQKLEDDFKKNKYFLNYYGRPILSINNPVNYFIQSSVADFAILCFKEFCHDKNIIPHAFIHDALIFSYPKSLEDNLKNIKYLKCPKTGIQIASKINKILHGW